MKIFIDSANLKDIEEALRRGFPSGITTNPSILAKEQKCDFKVHIHKIIQLVKEYGYHNIPLSVEVFSTEAAEMVRQAEDFVEEFHYENLNIKIPIGWDELSVIKRLKDKGIKVNCTCCMSYNQAVMAADAGSDFVSLFSGRIRDIGHDSSAVIRAVKRTLIEWGCPSKIIVGSIRHIADINEAMQAGADIVTVPPKFFIQMCSHPKTTEAVNQFMSDFKEWLK
ncbi:MAG: transaldolase family protein [bacterium]